MDTQKQKLLLEYLISSPDTFAICERIVEPKYFSPELRNSVSFIKDYYNKYSSTPTPDQINAESGVELRKLPANKSEIEYCCTEIEKFCRRKALELAALSAPGLFEKGEPGYYQWQKMITDALLISLNPNLGLRYYDNPTERLQRMLQEDPVHSTGWAEVDEALFGGIARKELLLVSANSGGGKSITLANLGYNFVHKNLNVLYVSLELAEDIVAQRFDTMHTGISRRDWKSHVSEIATRIEMEKQNVGALDIVQMSSGTRATDIRAYLKEYHLHYQMMPDLLIVDYLDKMNPNETHIDLSDVWTKDKLCSEQLRQIGVDFNMFVASASQLNREAVKATTHDHSHIAGGISKINESDVYWSIYMNETMKASGEMAFIFQKTRNSDGVGKTIYLKWDNKHLRILDKEDPSKKHLTLNKKSEKNVLLDTPKNGNGLLDLMSSTK